MPTIRVEMLEGRTAEQKRALVREVTQACVRTIGARPDSVTVLISELPREHWGRGGVLLSDTPAAPPKPPLDAP